MNGEELYQIYWAEMLAQNVECDRWEDLSEEDHIAWEKVADAVS